MSTRGIVAVAEAGSWAGFELRADAYPDWAGAEVIRLLRLHGLEGFCRRTRDATLISGMNERASPQSHGNRGDLQWAYVVDPAAGKLRVFTPGAVASAHALALDGNWGEVAVHDVSPDGACEPAVMCVKLPIPWPLLEVRDTWDVEPAVAGAFDAAAVRRLDVRRRVQRDGPPSSVDEIARAIAAKLTGALGAPVPERLFISRPWTSSSFYWRVQLGAVEVRYPPAGWARTGCIQLKGDGGELIGLFAEPQREVEGLDVQRAQLVPKGPLYDLLVSALPAEAWLFWFLDVVRAQQLPDARGEELERLNTRPQLADDWQVYAHPDGRVWSIRPSSAGYQLRLGDAGDDPVFKERAGTAADREQLIRDQLADGFVRR